MMFFYQVAAKLAILDLVDFAVMVEETGLLYLYSGDDVDEIGELNGGSEEWSRRLPSR